ncbi:Counting factor 60 [Smittium mucronatum]|uniref:Counting factor 60 n=1 Tax=Smittium mucronatum TaxID=133383 RepID=A0A1R0H264_9FUNG|nr:Counting factor 60 [Smittium mucronatum]
MKLKLASVFFCLFAYATSTISTELNKGDLAFDILQNNYNYCEANTLYSPQYQPVLGSDLVFVQTFIRHGDRAPYFINNSDLHLWNVCNKTIFNSVARSIFVKDVSNNTLGVNYVTSKTNMCKASELTQKGAEYSMNIGEAARRIYIDKLKFLYSEYKSQKQLRVRSTNADRTKETAKYFLSGLYPITPSNKNISTTVFHYSYDSDTMVTNSNLCQKITQIQNQIISTPRYQSYLAADPEITQKINLMFDDYQPNNTIFKNTRINQQDILQTRVCHQFKLPCNKLGQCATPSDAKLELNNLHFEVKYKKRDSRFSPQLVRFAVGPFFSQILQELNSAILLHKKRNAVRMSIYSCHDDTITNILGGLRADDFNFLWPPFNANIFIELWKNRSTGKFSIRIFNSGRILKVLGATQGDPSPWCDFNSCNFNSFSEYIKSIIPANLKAECAV